MTATFTWKIKKLDCLPNENGLSNVVKNVYWECLARQDNHVISQSGIASVPSPESAETFIQYSDLTESQVLNWVDYTVKTKGGRIGNKASVESSLQAKINSLSTTTPVSIDLPWGTPNLPHNSIKNQTQNP